MISVGNCCLVTRAAVVHERRFCDGVAKAIADMERIVKDHDKTQHLEKDGCVCQCEATYQWADTKEPVMALVIVAEICDRHSDRPIPAMVPSSRQLYQEIGNKMATGRPDGLYDISYRGYHFYDDSPSYFTFPLGGTARILLHEYDTIPVESWSLL